MNDDGMHTHREAGDLELLLACRSFCWGLIARAFAEEPDDAFLQLVADAQARREFALVQDGCSDRMADAFRALAQAAGASDSDELGREYVAQLVGPNTLLAPPWESIQLTKKKVLFQPEVLDVRQAYRRAGFLPAGYPHVNDDFVGIECDFMAKLALRAWKCAERGDWASAADCLRHSQAFLEERLGRWAASFARQMRTGYGAGFYTCAADVLSCQVDRDRTLLPQVLATLKMLAGCAASRFRIFG